MPYLVNNLEGWERVKFEELKANISSDLVYIEDMLYDYVINKGGETINLYIIDRGLLVRVIKLSHSDETSYALTILAFTPDGNVTDNPINYTITDTVRTINVVSLTNSFWINEVLERASLSPSVMNQIVRDYSSYNEDALLQPLIDSCRHIRYLDINTNEHVFVDDKASYEEILKAIESSKEKVAFSKSKMGAYFLEKQSCETYLRFVEIAYHTLGVDDFFTSTYYSIDQDMQRIYIPQNQLTLILDTVELFTVLGIPYTESIQPFESTDNLDALLDSALASTAAILNTTVIQYKTSEHIASDKGCTELINEVDVIINHYMPGSTDFVLLYAINKCWQFSEDIIRRISSRINKLEILSLLANNNRFANRKQSLCCTLFTSKCYLLKEKNLDIIERAFDRLSCYRDIVIDNISEDSISIWLMSSKSDHYNNMIFHTEGDSISFVECYLDLMHPKDKGALRNQIFTYEAGYIMPSLALYNKQAYIDYFK